MTSEMTELSDRWILPLRGSRIVRIDWGENVTFALDSHVQIVVGHGALFTKGPITAPGIDPVTLGQHDRNTIQQSLGVQIVSAVGFKTGALRIVFDNGWTLNVRSAGSFVPAAVISGDSVMWMRTETLTQR